MILANKSLENLVKATPLAYMTRYLTYGQLAEAVFGTTDVDAIKRLSEEAFLRRQAIGVKSVPEGVAARAERVADLVLDAGALDVPLVEAHVAAAGRHERRRHERHERHEQ